MDSGNSTMPGLSRQEQPATPVKELAESHVAGGFTTDGAPAYTVTGSKNSSVLGGTGMDARACITEMLEEIATTSWFEFQP